MSYIEHDFPHRGAHNKVAQKEGNAKAHLPDAQGVSVAAAVGVGGEGETIMDETFIGNVVVDEERNIKLPEQLPLKPSQVLEVFQEGDEVRLKLIDRKQLVEKLASLLHEALKGISYAEIKAERRHEDELRHRKIDTWTEASS